MVGQARYDAETLRQVSDSSNVRLLVRRWVGADAVEEHDLVATALARRVNRFADLTLVRHAARDDHRLAGACDARDQRKVNDLERRDLVRRCTEALEKID